jgi:hypothetical protein
MLPAALQGSCVLATAAAPFGKEWVGQVPDLQLGYLLPITTRGILRSASAQGTRTLPQTKRAIPASLADTAGIAESNLCPHLDSLPVESAEIHRCAMIEGVWHSVPNRTGSPTACWLGLRTDHASCLTSPRDGKRAACPREAETPNHRSR